MSSPNMALWGIALWVAYDNDLFSGLGLLQTLALGFAGLIVFVVVRQSALLYIPQPDPSLPLRTKRNPPGYASPREVELADYEDVTIETADGIKLHGWLIKRGNDEATRRAPTLLYFHGNAGNIGFRNPLYKLLWDAVPVNILAVDYRGYGESEGVPTEQGLRMDAAAALRFAETHPLLNPSRMLIFGRSLGGAVAVGLAAEQARLGRPVPGIIVENSFTSVADIATILFPFLRPFKSVLHAPLLANEWNSLKDIVDVGCPVLLLSGTHDELIPPAHMEALYLACEKSPRVPYVRIEHIQGGGHNDTPIAGGAVYHQHVLDFVRHVFPE